MTMADSVYGRVRSGAAGGPGQPASWGAIQRGLRAALVPAGPVGAHHPSLRRRRIAPAPPDLLRILSDVRVANLARQLASVSRSRQARRVPSCVTSGPGSRLAELGRPQGHPKVRPAHIWHDRAGIWQDRARAGSRGHRQDRGPGHDPAGPRDDPAGAPGRIAQATGRIARAPGRIAAPGTIPRPRLASRDGTLDP